MPRLYEDEELKITKVYAPKYTEGPRPKEVLLEVWPWAVHGRQSAWMQAKKLIAQLKDNPLKE